MTKEEVMTAIKECVAKLGHVPSLTELQSMTTVSKRSIRKHFCTYALTLAACGLERTGCGYHVSMSSLFAEWAGAVRRLGKIPTIAEFELRGRYSARPLMTRFKTWNNVPLCLLEYARKEGLESEWGDVLEIIGGHSERRRRTGIPSGTSLVTPGRSRMLINGPLYGTPLLHPALIHAPTNEQGVVFLFGAMACDLGYAVTRIQSGFPDGEAMRRVDHEHCQRVRIEFEHESRNFLLHLHDVKGCDLIVCWTHNWPECPLEVLELKEAVRRLGNRAWDRLTDSYR